MWEKTTLPHAKPHRLGKVFSKVVATINFVRLDFGNLIKLPYCFEFKIGLLERKR